MPSFAGGAPLPVTTGGDGPTDGRTAAIPVYVVSGGQAPLGQRAQRVIVVTSGLVAGGAAIPVYDAGPTALTAGEAAIPVYVVSGPNLWPLAYTSRITALNPIAYWPLAESSGSVAIDESGNGRNGAYTAVALGVAGTGDGRTAASFDGSTSVANMYTASLAGAFSGAAGTIALWAKVSSAAVWTDNTNRRMLQFMVDASNRAILYKETSNDLRWTYTAGGTAKTIVLATTPTAYFHVTITWDKAADQVKAYFNGAQTGATATGLGTWAGNLAATGTVVGATSLAPANPWSGSLAHVAVWNTALSAVQIAALAAI